MTGTNARLVAAFVAGVAFTVLAALMLTNRRRRRLDGDWSDEQMEHLYIAEPRRLVRPGS